jgi:hypothetical protein
MKFHVPIMELESAVDSISNTMYSLKSVQKIEFYDPYNTVIEWANYTFFKKKLPLYRASRLCNKMGANSLTLANLPQNTTLSGPLLLQFELSYGGRLYCVGPDRGLADDDCYKYLARYAGRYHFNMTQQQLVDTLKKGPVNTIYYLKATKKDITLTSSFVGYTGCVSKGSPPIYADKDDLHELYYQKMHSSFETVVQLLDNQVGLLSDSLHSFTLQSVKLLLLGQDDSWIGELNRYSPKFLLNHHNQQDMFPDFQKFFRNTVVKSKDDLIFRFTNATVLKELPLRTRLQIVSSFRQFTVSLKHRLRNLIFEISPDTVPDVPNTVLYKQEQNPVTFLNYITSLLPDADENLVVEAHILITNKKSSLLRDLAEINQLDMPVLYLSRFDFISSREDNGSGLSSQKPSPASSLTRIKRGAWGKFWARILDVASGDDVKMVQTLESANSANEFTMQKALADLSKTNFDIKDSMSQLGSTIGNITSQQQNLFSQVQYLTTTLAGTYAYYEHLAHTNQQSAMLASEYSALILQTILALDSLRKAQSLVSSAVTGTMDLSQVDTRTLY